MRIAIVHPFFDMYGGAEKVLFVLANALAKHYGEGSCEIYTSWFKQDFRKYLHHDVKVTVVRNDPIESGMFGQKFNPKLTGDMKRLGEEMQGYFDVIINVNWPSNIAVYHALKKAKCATTKKTVYYCFEVDNGLYHPEIYGTENSHVLEGKSFFQKLKAHLAFKLFYFWKKKDKDIVDMINTIVSISENNKKDIGKVYGEGAEKKTKVIPTFVDSKLFFPTKEGIPEFRQSIGIKEKDKVIFSLCRLGQSKRVDFIVRAFAGLLQKVSKGKENLKLVIGGTGPDEEKLRGLVQELGITKQVIFLGFVKDEDLVKVYNSCDLFVYAGLEANYVLTAFEAMACEKPVVVPQSRFEEIIGKEQGFAVDAHEEANYTEAFKRILAYPKEAAIIGKNARQRVVADYTEERFFERFKELFEEKQW